MASKFRMTKTLIYGILYIMKLSGLKNLLLKNKSAFFVFAIVFIVFSAVQFSTESLMGNDTHLYIKLAEMTKNGGLIKEFPWLNATIMKENFTGFHFLYYILLIPFTFLGSLITAAKIASVFFLSLIFSVFYLVLKSLRLKFSLFWTFLLLAGSGYFLFRMNMARPLNFSVIFTLIIFYSLIKKNSLLLFVSSFLFVWAHGSFPLSIFLASVFFAANYLYKKEIYYKSVLFSSFGIILGSIINPFFPNNLNYFNIYYLHPTPYSLTSQIAEWQPLKLDMIFADAPILLALFIALSLVYVFGLVISIINKNKKNDLEEKTPENKIILFFLFAASAIFFVGTLFQGRYIDYWVPFSVIFIAFYSELIYVEFVVKNDKLKKVAGKIKFPKIFSAEDAKITMACFLFIILGISARNKIGFVMNMSSDNNLYFNTRETALWLKENTPDKSVVFNVNWGDFSKLFFYNSDNYYILGLDPKFLYLKSPEKYWLYSHIGDGIVCGKEECEHGENGRAISDVMKKEFNADYVYVPTAYDDFDYTNLINIMDSDSNFEKVFENGGGQIWKLK